ncbi:hypothetical protein B0H65DRAFT_480051 [Neurospora tetraspora]|uniref:Uncharacterized protein n=1 Tax=Neurospora tetraspora TaxID=94610 RepID=A0AAE0J0S7_9PEZI|nr:hypothetical protein B0H65DRAFT_480051 [Neurospora tetraspora]
MGETFMITRALYEDQSLEADCTSYHLRNPEGEDFRTVFAETPNKKSKLSYSAQLTEIHHGMMKFHGNSCPATLIILEFRFHSKRQTSRYRSVDIDLVFRNGNGIARKDPEVVGMAPERQYHLNKTSHERTTTYGASLGANIGPGGLAGAETGVSWELCTKWTKECKATLTGESMFSPESTWRNALQWSMSENDRAEDGIPTFLQAAVLLRRNNDEPFTCQMSLKSGANKGQKFLRFSDKLTDEDKDIDPITLDPKRRQLESNRATGIQREDLGHMETLLERIGRYCKVSFSQTDLTPACAESLAVSAPAGHVRVDEMISESVVSEVPNMQPSNVTSLADISASAYKLQERASGVDGSTLHMVLLAAQEAAEAAAAATRAATKAMEAVNEATAAAARANKATNLLAEVTSRMVNNGECYLPWHQGKRQSGMLSGGG